MIRPQRVAIAAILAAGLAAYAGCFRGAFVLDDIPSIADNPSIRNLWDLGAVLTPLRGGGLTVDGRPVLNFSFAINYAISGAAPWSYHLVNVGIHLAAALTLFGLVRRAGATVAAARGGGGEPGRPELLGLGVALLWVVHPLNTGAVTYVVQRAESLMALFYLLTLYAFVRGAEPAGADPSGSGAGARRARLWLGASWLACLLGMATKEVMVSAPVAVLLLDRLCYGGSVAEAWRRRKGYHVALAATWVLLAALVLRAGSRGGTSAFGSGVSVWRYWATQPAAILGYLKLAVWPHPLVFDYGTGWVTRPMAVVVPLLAVTVLAAMAVIGLVRNRPWGYLAFCCFAVLAPTSVIPGNRQTMAEQRMYLALAAVIVLVVGAAGSRLGRRGVAVFLALSVGLGALTARRNEDYRSELTLYRDTVAKRPENAFAQCNLGTALFSLGRTREAAARYEEAVRLAPDYAAAQDNLGNALLRLGQVREAVDRFERALALRPDDAAAHNNLGSALFLLGRTAPAISEFEQVLRLTPADAEAHNNLANALAQDGRLGEAMAHYEAALRIDPRYAAAHNDLGNALAQSDRLTEAIAHYAAALRLNPGYAEAHFNLGNALVRLGRVPEGVEHYREALRLAPDYAAAEHNLGNALVRLGQVAEAITHYETALRLDPGAAGVHYSLANALLRLGRRDEAVAHYREALRLAPDFRPAREVLLRLNVTPP
ncbi:MAG TPA: tetratricopeptide repeat protein [Opitutaceae bacterium]|nr:tetratricopeptide repeat protein [Opitutaceae bacterium]